MTTVDEDVQARPAAESGARFPGTPTVINGNGSVAYVMNRVCGGVIGYPITPSTEISETFEAALANGELNVWGKRPFFFEPEGEHSAQSGALGAALTGGMYISNASSSQGVLYGMESHFTTVGKRVGGFVLQVAARVVTRHSLNVMAGHDDVYALLPAGYTTFFGSNPQEAADLAVIAYRVAATSMVPVCNAMDGFSTSHMMSECRLPEPELIREFVGDPASRIPCPTLAQELVFGAKGRVHQLVAYLRRCTADIEPEALRELIAWLDERAADVEADDAGELLAATKRWVPAELRAQFARQWCNAYAKGTRQLVPALVDPDNPGLTGPVQNQPDFQSGAADHRAHFVAEVPKLVRQAMAEFSELTGRDYAPVLTYRTDDADLVFVAMGSVTDDVRAVLDHLRARGLKIGLVAIKLLQPFPEADVVAALAGKKAVTVLERSDIASLTPLVTTALAHGLANADGSDRYAGVPGIDALPQLTTAIFGLGGHDLQPRHLIAAAKNMADGAPAPLVYLGSQFYADRPGPVLAELQDRLRAAYPDTELMALPTEANPAGLLPAEALRIRFHSVGGYGTIATGKLLTDILSGMLGMHSKAAPKYGSEKSGAPTNYYITLSPEPVLITNAELEDVEVVLSPDHQVFAHSNPLKGLVDGGTFILQSNLSPLAAWRALPRRARRTIRERHIRFFVIDAFSVAKRHAPTEELQTRMMGIAFIGALLGHVDRIAEACDGDVMDHVRGQIQHKFGAKGAKVVDSNMAVIHDGVGGVSRVDYASEAFADVDTAPELARAHTAALSAAMVPPTDSPTAGLFDTAYFDLTVASPFRDGTIGEAPVLPGAGMFIPAATAAGKDKGLFRRTVPQFDASLCTGCMECTLVCPDAAIPNAVHELHTLLGTGITVLEDVPEAGKQAMREFVVPIAEQVREAYRRDKQAGDFAALVAQAVAVATPDQASLRRHFAKLVTLLGVMPVARTRPFFDAMEAEVPGSGGLYSVTIDPWKCTGCLECVDVCGPHALLGAEQTEPIEDALSEAFALFQAMPNTPTRFTADATEVDGDTKRIFLDRSSYYAVTGGHGGCRGCGEVTGTRAFVGVSDAVAQRRRERHTHELEALVERLQAKRATLTDPARRARVDGVLAQLDRDLFRYEGGPTGAGPSGTVMVNSTGCSSVYASTMPFNPFTDPWVNSLFQDAQPVAKGVFEGIATRLVDEVRALRTAALELDDAYDPASHDAPLAHLVWQDLNPDELSLMPNVVTIGGDGATYDIGFGAMSRILSSGTPITIVVLDTGGYSNTGGQASTASFAGQDADLARVGSAGHGKREARKELALLSTFHGDTFVAATTTALQAHYLRAIMTSLGYAGGASVLDVYAACQTENGLPDQAASMRARMAVESRMNPVFTHDPRTVTSLHDWLDLDGNPDLAAPWTTFNLTYVDADGKTALLTQPLTPADFAVGEGRFKKQFARLKADEEAVAVPISEYLDLGPADRESHVPFVWQVDAAGALYKMRCSAAIVDLVEERQLNWQRLQYLAGVDIARLTSLHATDLDDLQHRYDAVLAERERGLDDIALAMSQLASSTDATPVGLPGFGVPVGAPPASAPAAAPVAAPASSAIVSQSENLKLCNDCKTCYQEIPELFERTTVLIDGEPRQIGRIKPDAVAAAELTDELKRKIRKVADNCDGEIIS